MSGVGRRFVPAISAMFSRWKNVGQMKSDLRLYGGIKVAYSELGEEKVQFVAEREMRKIPNEDDPLEVDGEELNRSGEFSEETLKRVNEAVAERVKELQGDCDFGMVEYVTEGQGPHTVPNNGKGKEEEFPVVVKGGLKVDDGTQRGTRKADLEKVFLKTMQEIDNGSSSVSQDLNFGPSNDFKPLSEPLKDQPMAVKKERPAGLKKATILKISVALALIVGIGLIAYNFKAIRASFTHGHPVGGGHAGDGPGTPIHTKPPVHNSPPVRPGDGRSGFGLYDGVWHWR